MSSGVAQNGLPGKSIVPHWDLGVGPISQHSWNKERTQLVVSTTDNKIRIFHSKNNSWNLEYDLEEHEMLVTGIDWAPNTNRIASCSQDKNAFVWTFEDGTWKPCLVVVRANKATTCIKWSPQENKIAIGTGARLVSICSYDKENDWWVPKQIKKPISSTVNCLCWHPNNVLIAIGSCDFTTRVFSTYMKEIDDRPDPNPWGSKMPFGQLLAEYKTTGWVHDVAFSPSGCRLAWVSHDSSLSIVDKTDRTSTEPVVHNSNSLPFTSVIWINEKELIVAGYDCQPSLFSFEGNIIKMVARLDVPPDEKNKNVNTAFQMFRNFSRTAADSIEGIQLKTLHQNTIFQVRPYLGRADSTSKFSTSGIDGLVAIWDVKRRAGAHSSQ